MKANLALIILFCTVAVAVAAPPPPPELLTPKCGLNENVSFNVTFNIRGDTPKNVKKSFDAKVEEVRSLAKEQAIDTINIQSLNYDVRANEFENKVSDYTLNGNISFNLQTADKATDLMDTLNKKDFRSYFSVNANRYVNCQ